MIFFKSIPLLFFFVNYLFSRTIQDEDTATDDYEIEKAVFDDFNHYHLNEAKSFWSSYGPSYKLKNKLVLMSEKIFEKEGYIFTKNKLKSDGSWSLTIDFLPIAHDVYHGEGLGIWLTTTNPDLNRLYERD